ncbi:hypothetical protein PO909_019095 [Leuciscus waleckii]
MVDKNIYIVQGEISVVVSAIKRNSRWSTHTPLDEEQDPLLNSFSHLKDTLNNIKGTKETPLIGQTTPSDDWMSTEFCCKHYSDTLIAGSFQALSVISSSPEQWAVEESFDCVFLIKKFAMPLTGLEYSIC